MKKIEYIVPVALLFLGATISLHASGGGVGGCVDSPENPTALLALVGVAGVCIAQLRNRLKL